MRQNKGRSICKQASISGVSKSQISIIERGLSNPTLDTIGILSVSFGYNKVGRFLEDVLLMKQ